MKKLIITAHDFGLLHSINLGTIYALQNKCNFFSQLSLVVNGRNESSVEAAKFIRANPQISCLLDLSFSELKPLVSGHKTLIDKSGNLKRVYTENWDFNSINDYDSQEIIKEMDAQYDWYIEHVGRKPDGLTSRKNVHGDPKILIPVVDLAKRENLPIRSPLWKWETNYSAQSFVIEEGIKCPTKTFIVCPDWNGHKSYDLITDFDQLIRDINNTSGDVHEILTFAGFVDEELIRFSSLNWQRGQILDIMKKKPEILQKLRDNFEIISFKDL